MTFTTPPPDLRYEQARRRAIRLRGFYIHSLAFVLGNTANFIMNLITRQNGGDWWFQWVLIPWSIALGIHALTLVGQGAWFGPNWEERKIRRYLVDNGSPSTPDLQPAAVRDTAAHLQTRSGQRLWDV
jgi:2TM domain